MRLEEILQILWRQRLYILLPTILVPIFAFFAAKQITPEYEAEAEVFIDESYLQHPIIINFGLRLDMVGRLPTIKKMMKGEEMIYTILGRERKEFPTPEELKIIAREQERFVVELTGPGVFRVAYHGPDPVNVKKVVDRMVDAFIKAALQPFHGVGLRLQERELLRDDTLNNKIKPEFLRVKSEFDEVKKRYTETSPEYLSAKHTCELWKNKVKNREKHVALKGLKILPLVGDNPDPKILATTLVPSSVSTECEDFEETAGDNNTKADRQEPKNILLIKRANDPDYKKLTSTLIPASIPLKPARPKKVKIVVVAWIAGLAFGFLITFIREFFDHSLREVGDVEQHLGLAVIGRIPKISQIET